MDIDKMLENDEARLVPWDDRYAVTRNGFCFSRAIRSHSQKSRYGQWKILTPVKRGMKYPAIVIQSKQYAIHHLVTELFIGPRPSNAVVRHMDDNPLNNSVSNLKYGTVQQNANDAIKNGRTTRGVKHPKAILSEWNIIQIRDMCASGYQHKYIAKKFNCSPATISNIFCGKNWGWFDQNKNVRNKRLNSRSRQQRTENPTAFTP